MSSYLKAELAATCSTLGRLHKGEYLIEPECIESVKDLIRYLKRDGEAHEIRLYLGESKVLQNDLIHVVKSCSEEDSNLFDVTLRLLINLTTPTMLFYGEDVPTEKTARNIYLNLVGYAQEYKVAFCDVDFWNKICGKLTTLFETDWSERSADEGIQIERMLMLLRNVLQVPADEESEKRPENDITVHDKVLWALRQSQILELLLFISSNKDEEQYYLNLLEIFSLILREQNPKLLARCDVERSAAEKHREAEDLTRVRESEKRTRNKYLNMRNFNATFVLKGVKSLSDKDIVCHKSLEKVNSWDLNGTNKKQVRTRRNRIPVESDRGERRSSYSVRLFLKEFSLEFLNCSFKHLMGVVKNKLDSGKSLANDQTYYFWGLRFFLDFAVASTADVDLVRGLLASESFHFVQTSMDNAFEHLAADKKKTVDWVKRIHLILKAYRSLLETLHWMDSLKNPVTRSMSREIKSEIFYVVEYREMTLHVLLRYDRTKFPVSYLRDLIETAHLFVKLLEDYSKQTKLVVQKVTRKKSRKKKKERKEEMREETWERIKDDVYDTLCCETAFPEIPPFDAALDIPIDEQKGRAMKKIQGYLRAGNIRDGIGFLRSARQVWPENDHFGTEGMSVEDETMALQEICLADLGEVEGTVIEPDPADEEEEESDEQDEENRLEVVEHDFDIMEYKKRLVNKRVIEGCGILLGNYKKNTDYTNHCVIKLLHRIGWECCMPAMLFQASIFWTLLKVMREERGKYNEIYTFGVNLMRVFRKLANKNPVVFLELLFWKDNAVALEIQHGYAPYESKPKQGGKRTKKNKPKEVLSGDEEGLVKGRKIGGKKGGRKRREKRTRSPDRSSEDEDMREHEIIASRRFSEVESPEKEVESERKLEKELESSGEEEAWNLPRVMGEQKFPEKVKVSSGENEGKENDAAEGIQDTLHTQHTKDTRVTGLEELGTIEDSRHSKDSDQSQRSTTASKKRVRKNEETGSSSNSDSDRKRSKSKRVRYVGSDSDVDVYNSEEDKKPQSPAVNITKKKRRRRRLAIIDSDSDVETNSLEEK